MPLLPQAETVCRNSEVCLGFAGLQCGFGAGRSGTWRVLAEGCRRLPRCRLMQEGLPSEGLCVYHDKQYAVGLACVTPKLRLFC